MGTRKIEWGGAVYDIDDSFTDDAVNSVLFQTNPGSFKELFADPQKRKTYTESIRRGKKELDAARGKASDTPGGLLGSVERSVTGAIRGTGQLAGSLLTTAGSMAYRVGASDYGEGGSMPVTGPAGGGAQTGAIWKGLGSSLIGMGTYITELYQDPQEFAKAFPKYKPVADWLAPVPGLQPQGPGDFFRHPIQKGAPLVAQNLPNLAATMAGSAIHPALGIGIGFSMEYGMAYQDAMEFTGGDIEQSHRSALEYGMLAGALEGLSGLHVGKVAGMVDDVLPRVLSGFRRTGKLVEHAPKKTPSAWVKVFERAERYMDSVPGSTISEGLTEGLQEYYQDKIITGEATDFNSYMMASILGGVTGGGTSFFLRGTNKKLDAVRDLGDRAEIINTLRRENPEIIKAIAESGRMESLNLWINQELSTEEFLEHIGRARGLDVSLLDKMDLRPGNFNERLKQMTGIDPELVDASREALNAGEGFLQAVLDPKNPTTLSEYYMGIANAARFGRWDKRFSDKEKQAITRKIFETDLIQVLNDVEIGSKMYLPADKASALVEAMSGTEEYKAATLYNIQRLLYAAATGAGYTNVADYVNGPGGLTFEAMKETALRKIVQAEDPDTPLPKDREFRGATVTPKGWPFVEPTDQYRILLSLDKNDPRTIWHELMHFVVFKVDPNSDFAFSLLRLANQYTKGKKIANFESLRVLGDENTTLAMEAIAESVGFYMATHATPVGATQDQIAFMRELKLGLKNYIDTVRVGDKIYKSMDDVDYSAFPKKADTRVMDFFNWVFYGDGSDPKFFGRMARREFWMLGEPDTVRGNLVFDTDLRDLYELEDRLTELQTKYLKDEKALRRNTIKELNRLAKMFGMPQFKSPRNGPKKQREAARQAFVDQLVGMGQAYRKYVDDYVAQLERETGDDIETLIVAPEPPAFLLGKRMLTKAPTGAGQSFYQQGARNGMLYQKVRRERVEDRLLQSNARGSDGRLLTFNVRDWVNARILEQDDLYDPSGDVSSSSLYVDAKNIGSIDYNNSGSAAVFYELMNGEAANQFGPLLDDNPDRGTIIAEALKNGSLDWMVSFPTYDALYWTDPASGKRLWILGPDAKVFRVADFNRAHDLKAPNGRPSKLSFRQWHQVRTKAFKDWFGDWENNPAEASKAIDPETGEPLVLYHATEALENFESFRVARNDIGVHVGTLATAEARVKSNVTGKYGGKARIIPVFVNVRNMKNAFDAGGWNLSLLLSSTAFRNSLSQEELAALDPLPSYQKGSAADSSWALRGSKIDGIAYQNTYETGTPSGNLGQLHYYSQEEADLARRDVTVSYVIMDPKNIKSAIANRGTFNGESSNILLQAGKRRAKTPVLEDDEVAGTERMKGRSIPKWMAGPELEDDFEWLVGDLTRPEGFESINPEAIREKAASIFSDNAAIKEVTEKVLAADPNMTLEEIVAAGLVTNEMMRTIVSARSGASSHAKARLSKAESYLDAYSNMRSRAGQLLSIFSQRFGPMMLIETVNKIAARAPGKYGRVLMQMTPETFFELDGLNLTRLTKFEELLSQVDDPEKLTDLQKRVHAELYGALAGGAPMEIVNHLISESIFVMNQDEMLADLMSSYFYTNALLSVAGRMRDFISSSLAFMFNFYAIQPTRAALDMLASKIIPGYQRREFLGETKIALNPKNVFDAYKLSQQRARDILTGRQDLAEYQNMARWELHIARQAQTSEIFRKYGNKRQKAIGKTLAVTPRLMVGVDVLTRVAASELLQEQFEYRRIRWARDGIENEMLIRIAEQMKDASAIQHFMKINHLKTSDDLLEVLKQKPEEVIPLIEETWISRASAETTFQQKPGYFTRQVGKARDRADREYRNLSRAAVDAAKSAFPFVPEQALDWVVAFSPARFMAVPFLNTLVNVAKFSMEMMPASLMLSGNMIGAVGPLTTLTWRSKGDLADSLKELIARQAVAHIMLWLVGWAVDNDWLVGGARDRAHYDWMERNRIQPYSFRVQIPGDDEPYWVPIPEPFQLILGPMINNWEAARMANLAGSEEEAEKIIKRSLVMTGTLFTNSTLLREMNNLLSEIGSLGGNEQYGLTARMARTAGNFIPFGGMLRAMNATAITHRNKGIAPWVDKKDASFGDLIYTEHFSGFFGDDLGWVKRVPEKMTYFGQPIGRAQYLGLNIPVNWLPEARAKFAMDPVEQEFGRLEAYPGMPGKDVLGVELSEDEYLSYVTYYGQLVKHYGNQLVGSKGYVGKNDFVKEQMLDRLLSELRKAARAKMLSEYGGLRERIRQERVETARKWVMP